MVATEKNLEKIAARLRAWDVKIDALVAQAEGAATQLAPEHRLRIDDLRAKRDVARARLDELRADGYWKWQRYSAGIGRAWSDLIGAFRALERDAGD